MIKDFTFESLWAIPMLKTTVDLPHEEIAEFLREQFDGWGKAYTSFYDNRFNDHLKSGLPHAGKLEEVMTLAGHMFAKERGYSPEPKLDYWFSVYQTGDEHNVHTHPQALVAGTYYPYADDNSTKIRYHNPSSVAISHTEVSIPPEQLMLDHYPTTGEMNLWPAWLQHEVRPQKPVDPSEARIAISFNYGRS